MTIKLEVGKFYRARDGEKVGIVGLTDDCEYPFRGDNREEYTDSGVFYLGSGNEEFDLIAEWTDAAPNPAPNKYARKINGAVVDVYDILAAYDVRCPAIKKLLMPGQRGGKSKSDDMREALASVQRAVEMGDR